MAETWTAQKLLETARSYQSVCVLLAAAELDLFTALGDGALSAGELAERLGCDGRATTFLADALAALGLLAKAADGRYALVPGTAPLLTAGGGRSVLPMLCHQANCLRGWAQLAATVKAGRPVDCGPSVRGGTADHEAFIEAMEVASRQAAARVVAALGPPSFRHLLDVGGGPATWTIAFLQAAPDAQATLYDRPTVIPIARRHVEAAGLAERVRFAPGDFYNDEALPTGADLAWVSAIVHQSSRRQNRELFTKVHAALAPGGQIAVRDIVMDDSHTEPPAGALFAINMLVHTAGGGTFSFAELVEDLAASGFTNPRLQRGERPMDAVIRADRAPA
jgi:precorrin-6B methylase 2